MGDQPEDEEVRQRVREAILKAGGVPAVAARTGIPPKTLENYLSKRSTPSLTTAAKIAAATGVPLAALVGRPPEPVVEMAVELVHLAGEAVTRIYLDENVRIPQAALPSEIARFYASVLDDGLDGEEPRRRVDAQAERLRSELRAAAAAPGTGKREAS